MALRIVNSISSVNPSKTVNEDRILFLEEGVGVLDGATGLDDTYVGSRFDANWFLTSLEFFLSKTGEAGFEKKLKSAMRLVAASYEAPAHRYQVPSSGLIFVEELGFDSLNFMQLGDCHAFVGNSTTYQRVFGESVLESFDQGTIQKVCDKILELGDPMQAREEILPLLRANREKMNTPDGYSISRLSPQDK